MLFVILTEHRFPLGRDQTTTPQEAQDEHPDRCHQRLDLGALELCRIVKDRDDCEAPSHGPKGCVYSPPGMRV